MCEVSSLSALYANHAHGGAVGALEHEIELPLAPEHLEQAHDVVVA